MPATITPVNSFDTATAITRPVPGERTGMETGASPLAPLLQRFVDRDEALRLGLLGQMAGGDRMSVDPGGTSTVFAVRVSAIRSALIKDAVDGVWRGVSLAAQTLGLSATVGPLAALAADTWYYVTLAVEAGVPRLYINTFAPDDSLVWEAGSPDTFRYVGCFRTDASGAPIAVEAVRGRYTYDPGNGAGADATRVLSSGGATTHTVVSCASIVPPHVRNARLLAQFAPALAGDTFSLRRNGISSPSQTAYAPAAADCTFHPEVLLDAAQEFTYRVTSGGALTLNVVGFSE